VSSSIHARKVKAVCFDVGNVLVEIDIVYAIARLGFYVDDRLAQKIQALGQWKIYDAFERGHLREAQFLHELSAHLALDLRHTELVAWWNSSLRKLVDGVERVVGEIIGHVPVYALTNTNPLHFDYFMRHMPLLQRFDHVIASFHVGHRKPEAQLFKAAAQLIGQSPEAILFIDDLMANVEGAKAIGYQAELCDRSSTKLREILVQYGVL
jgi:HAD superfamily hydrolase (TIGR01509 family)